MPSGLIDPTETNVPGVTTTETATTGQTGGQPMSPVEAALDGTRWTREDLLFVFAMLQAAATLVVLWRAVE